MSDSNYIIITPARNEQEHLPRTIDSVISQTLKPRKWILVDDGSTDRTGQIMDAAANEHRWITVVHRPDRGFRKSGGGVMEAFYDGYDLIGEMAWDFLVKLDGDLSFGASYFADCFGRFAAESGLGIGGGTICGMVGGELVTESSGDPPFHVRGATKIYRRACWEAIGGLMKAPGWDSLDELKANMLGWKTFTFRDLKLHQHRHTGEADGCWKNWVKNGLANYIAGYHPAFMLVKCARRALHTGSLTIPAGLGWGFLSGYLKRVPQADPAVVRFVRREQTKCLCLRSSLWS